jgi:hypothetical protein
MTTTTATTTTTTTTEMGELVPEFQLKKDSGGMKFFDSFEKVYKYILDYDPKQISKLSWGEHVTPSDKNLGVVVWKNDENKEKGGEHYIRFRPKTKDDRWEPESEKKISFLCSEYENCQDNDKVFWVHQMISDFDFLKKERDKYDTEEEWDKIYMPRLIVEAKTTEEFEKEYVYNTKRKLKVYPRREKLF